MGTYDARLSRVMKRVLIVYHSFDEWEMGPIRMRRIARNLPRFGYEPVVLTSRITSRSTAEIPAGVEVLRAHAVDLAELYSRLRRAPPVAAGKEGRINRNIGFTSLINRWLMVPDKQITWLRPAIAMARRYLRERPVDLVFGSLAPRTNLLVAVRIAREFRLPCIVEFRDLWTDSFYRHLDQPTSLHRRLHQRLERRVIRDADRVSVVSRGLAERLQAQYPDVLRHPIALHYNFYDLAELEGIPARRRKTADPFVISYVGNIYDRRNPYAFFEGLRRFLDRREIGPERFRFRWAGGAFGLMGLEERLAHLRLTSYIEFLGHRAHRDALRLLRESDMALIIQAEGDTIHVPGKLFEAVGANVPILAISDPCETAELVERLRAGVVAPHEPEAIAHALERVWEWWLSGAPWNRDEEACSRFSAEAAVGRLAEFFNETIRFHSSG